MAIIESGKYIYAINPVWTEDTDNNDITITSNTDAQIMSVLDCSDKTQPGYINNFVRNIPMDSYAANNNNVSINGLVGIASTVNSTSVFTVSGVDSELCLTDAEGQKISGVNLRSGQNFSGTYQDILICGSMPTQVGGLGADITKGVVRLYWYDNADDEIGVFIYRLDHNDPTREFRAYLLDTVNKEILSQSFHPENYDSIIYTDITAKKGHEYTYWVVPYNEVSKASAGNPVTIRNPSKASDTFAEEVRDDVTNNCFISTIN